MVWLCFPGMTSSLANHRCTLSDVFSTIFLFLTFLNSHIYFIVLKTYDQQFTLTTKKSLHIIFKTIFFASVKKVMLLFPFVYPSLRVWAWCWRIVNGFSTRLQLGFWWQLKKEWGQALNWVCVLFSLQCFNTVGWVTRQERQLVHKKTCATCSQRFCSTVSK